MLKFVVFALAVSASQAAVFSLGERNDGNLESSIKNYPYLLSVEYFGRHICSATIISSNYAVAASACFDYKGTGPFHVRAGSLELLSGGIVVKVKEVFKMGNDNDNKDRNLSVLELSEPLVFSETIQKIAIPRRCQVAPINVTAKSIGWGPTHLEGEVVFQSVDVFTVTRKECRRHYPTSTMTERMLCAKNTVCHDDYGGPLVYDNTLIGFYSWAKQCDPYSVYVDIAVVRDYITEIAGI
ncbi:PREDICTED: trypsin-7-like [Nicrophorus vespilloides]|uniref:Trypsin-7-like n=1 Tax=Nicrophorus vespilloides TaxID=110193 RepID=A0ABM1MH45_NICVS|nr:PREDICTED: trypsin-7-like [Nicrophorus vespilloides]